MSTDASKIPTITGGLVQRRDEKADHVRIETNLQKIVLMQRHAEHQHHQNRSKRTTNQRTTSPFLSFFQPSSALSFSSNSKRDSRKRPNSKMQRFNLLGKPIDERLIRTRKRLAIIRKYQFLTHNFLERPDNKSAISYHILQ